MVPGACGQVCAQTSGQVIDGNGAIKRIHLCGDFIEITLIPWASVNEYEVLLTHPNALSRVGSMTEHIGRKYVLSHGDERALFTA